MEIIRELNKIDYMDIVSRDCFPGTDGYKDYIINIYGNKILLVDFELYKYTLNNFDYTQNNCYNGCDELTIILDKFDKLFRYIKIQKLKENINGNIK